MNYSKKVSRKMIAEQVIKSWLIVGAIGLVIGIAIGCGVSAYISHRQTVKAASQRIELIAEEYPIYGEYDGTEGTESPEPPIDWGSGLEPVYIDCALPEDQQEFLYYLCDAYNLDYSFVVAVMDAESGFDPDAVSVTDDWGLMQINGCNHEWLTENLGITDFLDPYQNMRAGCYILKYLFEKYQEADMVLMAYNMGESSAAVLWEQGVYSTDYTDRVFALQQEYFEQIGGE